MERWLEKVNYIEVGVTLKQTPEIYEYNTLAFLPVSKINWEAKFCLGYCCCNLF
jgi:hypothetical protein